MESNKKKLPIVNAYINGCCTGNPGMGSFVSILTYIDSKNKLHKKTISAGYKKTTSNRMELVAVIKSIETLNQKSFIIFHTNCKYLINSINNGWLENWSLNAWKGSTNKTIKNSDLWQKLYKLLQNNVCEFIWDQKNSYNEEVKFITSEIYKKQRLYENDI